MAAIEEAIRIVLEAEGAEGIKTLRKVLADLGETGELTREQVGDLAGEVLKFGEAAADGAGIKRAIDSYQQLAATQDDVAGAMEAARLKLSILAEAETDAARAVQERRRALDDARGALAEYQNSVDKTSEGLAEQRRQVSDASAALKKAEDSWGSITASLAGANDEFDAAYKAQERLNAGLERHGDRIREAGLSTDDLADAQAELATRTEAAGQSLADQIQNARSAAAAQRELGEATREAAEAAAQAERDFAGAWRALGGDGALRDTSLEIERLETAYRTLASSGRLSSEQLSRAQEQLQARVQRLREGTAEYRAEQDRASVSTDRLRGETNKLGAESGAAARALGGLKATITGIAAGLSVGAIAEATGELLELAEVVERSEQQFARLYGSVAQGQGALAELRELAVDLGQSYDATREAAASLKTFGLDPLDGTLRALIDTNTAMGGNQQKLEGMILAVGQAWAKQKLQGEEALQLIERGVPVWDLLAKATGKTTVELQKMSSAGELGRDAIKLLVEQMGKANFGAAAEQAGSFAAQLRVLRDEVERLGAELGMGGLEGAADAIGAVTEKLRELAASPEFAQLKEQFGVAFEQGAAAAKELLQNLDLTAALEQLAQTARILTLIGQHMERVSKHAGTLQKITDALSPHNEMLAGIEWVLRTTGDAYDYLGGKIDQYRGKVEEATEKQEALNEALEGTAESAPDLVQTYGGIIQAVVDATGQVVDVMTMANETIDSLAHRGAEVFQQLQEAIKDGTDPAAVQALQLEFDELQERIRNAEQTGYALTDAMMEIAFKAEELGAAFDTLKIKSQASLLAASTEAEQAFTAIVVAAKNGQAATEDVARAFEVYARRAMEAAKYSSEAAQQQVEAQLKARASALGLTDSLERLGLAGKKAGDETAESMGRAGIELQNVADAASDAADAMDEITSSATTAAGATQQMAEGMGHVTRQVVLTNNELSGTSKLFQQLANERFGDRIAGAFNSIRLGNQRLHQGLRDQTAEYEKQLAALQEQNMALDAVGQRVLELRRQFSYLSDDRLRALAQEQLRYEQATGAGAEQNRNLASGNELLRERNALLDKQGQQTVQTTKVVEVRLTAGVGRVEFNVDEIQRADIRKLAKLIIQEIEMDRQ